MQPVRYVLREIFNLNFWKYCKIVDSMTSWKKNLNLRALMWHFSKVLWEIAGAQPEIFQGRGGFVKLGHFDKHFVKNSRKRAAQGKFLSFFS